MTFSSQHTVISEETRRRIEQGLLEWSDPTSAARQRFEAANAHLGEVVRPLEEAVIASERLTADDFAIRINTRE